MAEGGILHQPLGSGYEPDTNGLDHQELVIRNEELQRELSNVRERLSTADNELHRLKVIGPARSTAARDSYRQEFAPVLQDCARLRGKVAGLKDQISTAQREEEALRERITELEDQVSNLQDRLKNQQVHATTTNTGATASTDDEELQDAGDAPVSTTEDLLMLYSPPSAPPQMDKSRSPVPSISSDDTDGSENPPSVPANAAVLPSGGADGDSHDVDQGADPSPSTAVPDISSLSITDDQRRENLVMGIAEQRQEHGMEDEERQRSLATTNEVKGRTSLTEERPNRVKGGFEDLVHEAVQEVERLKGMKQMLSGSRDTLRKTAEDIPRLEKHIGFLNDELQRLRGEAQQLGGRAEAPNPTERRRELKQTTKTVTREVNGLKKIVADLEITPALEASVESLEKLLKEMRSLQPENPRGILNPSRGQADATRRSIRSRLLKIRSQFPEDAEGYLAWMIKEAPGIWQVICARIFALRGSTKIFPAFCQIREPHPSLIRGQTSSTGSGRLEVVEQPRASFRFDRIFPPDCDAQVFKCLKPYVQCLLIEKHLHLFCYRATAVTSEKNGGIERGVLRRLLKELYLVHEIINRHDRDASLSVSSFILHDNKARDCLTDRDLSDGDTPLPLHEEPVSDPSQGDRILDRALKSRDEHTHPSISHWGFQIIVREVANPGNTAKFTLMELANGDGEVGQTERNDICRDLSVLHACMDDIRRTGKTDQVGQSTLTQFLEPTLSEAGAMVIKMAIVDGDGDSAVLRHMLCYSQMWY
ncbi:MAG: hypothetical protein Q9208_003205 [Pyrenodesmia sp. 3 TL-2023]